MSMGRDHSRWRAITIGVAVILAGASSLRNAKAQGGGAAARPATTEPVATAVGWVDVEGGLRRLGVASGGTIEEVTAKEGDIVEPGAVLLRLDDREARLEAQGAAIEVLREQRGRSALVLELGRRREDAKRLQPLVAAEAEPVDELRRARAEITDLESRVELAGLAEQGAKLKADLAAERLKRLQVRAPLRGEVLRMLGRVGDTAAPGVPLVWFAAEGRRIVRAELDERLFGRVAAGMKAEVRPEYDDAKIFAARVIRMGRAVGPVEGLLELRPSAKADRVVECVLTLDTQDLLIGQRVLVRVMGGE